MNKKIIGFILAFNILLGLFFCFYKLNQVPPCLNADEAAFGYNAYSMLKTGRDEYGRIMPLRLESFKDYKLPLYSVLSIPIIATFGYNDVTTRALNIMVMVFFIPLTYLILKELWKNEKVALLGSFLVALNPGLYILTRHAHEGPLCSLFILLSVFFLIRYTKEQSFKNFLLSNVFILFSTFSYHYGRVFLGFFVLYQIFLIVKTKKIISKPNIFKGLVLLIAVAIPLLTDLKFSANRVKNLAFYQNKGYELRITEYLNEHPFRLLHNKAVESLRDVSNRYMTQISPEFLVVNGDANWRFGMPNLSPLSAVEYIFFFIGLYFLFHKREKYRLEILFLFLISPVANALTWQEASLIRSYFILFPIIFIASYGVINFIASMSSRRAQYVSITILVALYGYYSLNSWDLYFNHYPKRALTIRAWQCGYKEIGQYVKENYNKYDHFYITSQNGQPYIYILHYLKYDPANYQKQAHISSPDEYGFGQVEKFDKFIFKIDSKAQREKTAFIGFPDEIKSLGVDESKVKKVKSGTEEIFWIYGG